MLKALDTLTKIIERSTKVLQTLEAYGGHRKRRKLAQTIHLTYLRLNECISTGEHIIDVLQSFAKDPSQYSYSGRDHIQGDGIYLDSYRPYRENPFNGSREAFSGWLGPIAALGGPEDFARQRGERIAYRCVSIRVLCRRPKFRTAPD
jgi:hypothetical protein